MHFVIKVKYIYGFGIKPNELQIVGIYCKLDHTKVDMVTSFCKTKILKTKLNRYFIVDRWSNSLN